MINYVVSVNRHIFSEGCVLGRGGTQVGEGSMRKPEKSEYSKLVTFRLPAV